MPPEFRPGFRFSAYDALILAAGAVGFWLVWPRNWQLGFVIAFVVGHFFLFCNVFRVSRGLELLWAAVFLALTRTAAGGHLSWESSVSLTLCTTAIVIGIQIRKPSYHGIAWDRLNPHLRQWWDANVAAQDE